MPLYLTLTQLSRSAKAYYPLMLLLILTLGLGVYNSSAARTIDLNSTEQTLYHYGSDVIVKTVWEGYAPSPAPTRPPSGGRAEAAERRRPGGNPAVVRGIPAVREATRAAASRHQPPQMFYREPPFEIFSTLEGVEHAAQVLQTKANVVVSGQIEGAGQLLGHSTMTSFAEVAWFRDDMFPKYHPYAYLDALAAI